MRCLDPIQNKVIESSFRFNHVITALKLMKLSDVKGALLSSLAELCPEIRRSASLALQLHYIGVLLDGIASL